MKKLFLILFILTFTDCFAGTGNASDGLLMVATIIIVIMIGPAIVYLIHFLRNRIRHFREARSHDFTLPDGS